MEYPKLRPLEAFPVEVSGKEAVCLRDPSNLTDKLVFVPYSVFQIIRFFDGRHSILDIQVEHAKRYGGLILREHVEKIVKELDSHLLLESNGFHSFLKGLKEDFRNASLRKAILAGRGYEGTPERLRDQLEGYFLSKDGPGQATRTEYVRKARGAVLPHIDFGRGGPCFAWGYKEIEESTKARCFILLGTAHGEMDGLFALTKKDFETPFGVLSTNRALVEILERHGGETLYKGEFAHRAEHSIEFQAVFLQYVYNGRRDITIVPILCSSFHEMLHKGISPSSVSEVSDFVCALKEAIREYSGEVFVLASADLSHVGPRFGDPFTVTKEVLSEVAREDMEMIRFIEKVDAEGFFSSVHRVGDRRRICGLAPIYVLLQVVDASQGKLLKYEQWPDPMGTVSFASICLY